MCTYIYKTTLVAFNNKAIKCAKSRVEVTHTNASLSGATNFGGKLAKFANQYELIQTAEEKLRRRK